MNTQPLVTIVTPSFNQGAYLEATILSVLNQDYPAMEYLVVDGGSTDDSVDIIRKYQHRIHWWVSEKDAGQSDAINKGLRRARGEVVGWLNSDDVYEPGAVASAVEVFLANPTAGLVYGDARSIDSQGKQFNLMQARQYDLVDLLSFQIICQPASFMNRLVLEQVNYLDPGYHLLMDHLLWIRMAEKAPIIYSPRVWASARYHAQAKNRTQGAAYGREARVLIEDLYKQPHLAGIIDKSSRRIWAGVNRFDAFYLTDAGEYSKALQAYGRALGMHTRSTIKDWRHILLALVSWLGLPGVRKLYEEWRLRHFSGGK